MIEAAALKAMIERELGYLSDARVAAHIRGLLVEPEPILRRWDYGKPGEQFVCWMVLGDDDSKTGIAYCESGFGPRMPWGLVSLGREEGETLTMGMDSAWFPNFLDAYFDSFAATQLAIWRMFKTDSSGARHAITQEDSWEATWRRVKESRAADPGSRYDCGHSIAYSR